MIPINTNKTKVASEPEHHRPEDVTMPEPPPKPKRTAGLKLFDAFLYPFLTNFVVFVLSVAATYLTTEGGLRRAADGTVLRPTNKLEEDGKRSHDGSIFRYHETGSLTKADGELIYGRAGNFFFKRGAWLEKQFGKVMTESQAKMAKMVFFSFADGTLVAPMVKLLEDRREKIAYWFDKQLGTVPEDKSIYEAEPKQSWLSVIGGRFATVSIVVPTAVALSKIGQQDGKWSFNLDANNPTAKSLNDILFIDPGVKTGQWVESKPKLAKLFGKLNISELFKTGYFEFFYTSVCTAGLYFSSRLFASFGKKKADTSPASNKPEASSDSTPTAEAQPSASAEAKVKSQKASEQETSTTSSSKAYADASLKSRKNAPAGSFKDRKEAEAEASMLIGV